MCLNLNSLSELRDDPQRRDEEQNQQLEKVDKPRRRINRLVLYRDEHDGEHHEEEFAPSFFEKDEEKTCDDEGLKYPSRDEKLIKMCHHCLIELAVEITLVVNAFVVEDEVGHKGEVQYIIGDREGAHELHAQRDVLALLEDTLTLPYDLLFCHYFNTFL